MQYLAMLAACCAARDMSVGGLAPRVEAAQEPRLDRRIRLASRAQYERVDSSEWRNPYLLISGDGVQLQAQSLPEPRSLDSLSLRRALVDLPVTDWPYGRVVAVQDASIVEIPITPTWRRAMRQIEIAVRTTLKALGLVEARWPA
jgi:hypothetical protein